MLEVLLTHSYFIHFDPKEEKGHMPYPPLGTITAAANLRSQGFSVDLHDVMLSAHEDEIIPVLGAKRPRVVVIYDDSFNFLTKMCLTRMRQAAFRLARFAREAGCSVIVFSSDASDHVDEYLSHDADYVICGDAEETLAEVCHLLLRGSSRPAAEIPGIAFLNNSGQVVRTQKRPPIHDLDMLPLAAWDLVDLEKYRNVWMSHHGYFSLNISTTRGCPFHCNWCAKPLYGQVYNSRSPENVVKEMLYLKTLASPDHLWITDDIFGLKPGWIQAFDELVSRENAKIPFKCLSRADLLLKEDTVRHLKSAGCSTVWIGAESGSQKILDAMEKGTTVEQVYEASGKLRSAGIRTGFFLQFGYPGETMEDIHLTMRMVRECQPDEIGISVSYPLPGTKFHEAIKGRLGEKRNWLDSQDLDLMFRGTYQPDFYRALHKVMHKKFRVWNGLRTARDLMTFKMAPQRKNVRSIASLLYHGVTLPLSLRKLSHLQRQPLRDPA